MEQRVFRWSCLGVAVVAVTASLWMLNDARLAVRDTGSGIPESEHENIFEEFYQVSNPERDRSKGLGLGLAIVKKVVLEHGGEVRLDQAPEGGARFTIELPLLVSS